MLAAFVLTVVAEVVLGWKPLDPWDYSQPFVSAGVVLIVLGLLLRSWAAGTLKKKKKLATAGPYRMIRHPLYLGSILLLFGFASLTGIWLNFLVCAIVSVVAFGHAIRQEEAFLAQKFGPLWIAYSQHTGRLVPRQVTSRVIAPWNIRRWVDNREYNAVLAVLGLLGGVLLWWYC